MRLHKALMLFLIGACCMPALANDLISAEPAERLISFGARIGLNTSNVTMSDKVFKGYNINSWGTGFDAGFVADINFREFFSVQPGFFYQSRTGRYFYGGENILDPTSDELIQAGHMRSYRFNIPILASFHLNVTESLRWNIDFGPYFGFNLYSNEGDNIMYSYYEPGGSTVTEPMRLSGSEFGLKMGTGIRILGHYVVGVHYMAGISRPWKLGYAGGRSKCWTFTVGYDF